MAMILKQDCLQVQRIAELMKEQEQDSYLIEQQSQKIAELERHISPMTQEEIKMILLQSSEQGVIDKEETEMLRDVFRFSDKRANELMTHRRDLVIFHPDDTKDKVMKTIEEEHYSKYLLVDERKDEIIGVVSVKDIILMVGNKKEFNLREIARPALFIPESLYANKILELFKKNKNKFGVVVLFNLLNPLPTVDSTG